MPLIPANVQDVAALLSEDKVNMALFMDALTILSVSTRLNSSQGDEFTL